MKIKDIILQTESLSFKEALEYMVEKSQKNDKKTFIITINPEIIMLAMNDRGYEGVLKSADLALADGVGVLWAGKMFGKSFRGRVHGVDLVEGLAKEVSEKPITVGFLGGSQNVAQSTADCLRKKYPGLKVAFALEEWPGRLDDRKSKIEDRTLKIEHRRSIYFQPSTLKNLSSTIYHQSSNNNLFCDILFVAFGSPKQENWIHENIQKIDSKVFIGVGGAFDFISGRVPRAPVFIRSIGLEWLFRLMIQPWRIRRQIALVRFVLQVLREKLK